MRRRQSQTTKGRLNPVKELSGRQIDRVKKLPRRQRGVPYTALEAENPVSSQGIVRRPSMTRGRRSNQSGPARRARREVFKERWKRSKRPLDWGWKFVVFKQEMFSKEHKAVQREEINCAPRSEVILAGTPNLEIQQEIKALALVVVYFMFHFDIVFAFLNSVHLQKSK